jgi:Xaa-Pro dipeptidase
MLPNDFYPQFSDAEFSRRFALVRAAMRVHDLSALVLYGTISNHYELQYLSGYPVTWEAFLIFPVEGDPSLLLELYNHVPNARNVASTKDVHWGGPDLAETTSENVRERGLAEGRIGLVGLLPMQRYEVLTRLLPRATFVDFTATMMDLRLVKSDEEVEVLRRGAELSDLAIEALEREARPGLTEHELAAIIEAAYVGRGGQTNIHYLATTPMEYPAACVPAQRHSMRVLERGDVLITEISAMYIQGYPGQILRPFTIGRIPPTVLYQRLYDVAVDAFERICAVIRPGTTTDEVLDAANSIHQAGLSIYDDLLHSYGGGYLPPVLRTRQTRARPPDEDAFTFREGMTIVVQPNVITLDQHAGVQVGELLVVTQNGVESLHRYPMRFVQCG